jgi:hypothetical protein
LEKAESVIRHEINQEQLQMHRELLAEQAAA